MSVMMNFAMFPVGKSGSLSGDVAKSLSVVEASGLDYRFGPMGTCVEGEDLDGVLAVVRECFELMRASNDRVYGTISFDYRQGDQPRMMTKVEHVEQVLGRDLRHG